MFSSESLPGFYDYFFAAGSVGQGGDSVGTFGHDQLTQEPLVSTQALASRAA
jgi:hypothetical protein